jgi:thiol peroxidase
MAVVTLKGNPIHTIGQLPAVGTSAPTFDLVGNGLKAVNLAEFKGSKLILNIFPSIDTPTCATSTRKFNEKAGNLNNVKVLCISADLPFAQGRFCAAEGLTNVLTASVFRSPDFGRDYGVLLVDGPLQGLLARAVVLIDENGQIIEQELVPEIAQEPDYDKVLAKL